MAKLDNSTRWNSTYLSLERALKLRSRIRAFCYEEDYAHDLGKDTLDDAEWQQLTEIAAALKPFWQTTLRVEGNAKFASHGAIWEALPTLEALQEILEEGLQKWAPHRLTELLSGRPAPARRRDRGSSRSGRSAAGRSNANNADLPPMAIAYQNAWEKLTKYTNLTDVGHEIYAAAVLFHPSHRKHYFDNHWTGATLEEWKDVMITNVKTHWQDHYSHQQQLPKEPPATPAKEQDPLDRFLNKYKPRRTATTDVFDAYINAPATEFNDHDKDTLFPWWQKLGPPALRQRALDLLSIPAMSAEIERIFSQTKRLITTDRNRMTAETIEQRSLLHDWYKHNLIGNIDDEVLQAVKLQTFGLPIGLGGGGRIPGSSLPSSPPA